MPRRRRTAVWLLAGLFPCMTALVAESVPETFETPAAGTIPLFILDREYVREIYGDEAARLVLGEDRPHEQIVDVLTRPEHYADIVRGIRKDFALRHAPEARMRELIEIVRE